MIVRTVARGHSFKKLAAYLTQPKEGQHRALWSMTENVAVDDPRTAARIMAHTAIHADELKAAAGIATRGRKAKEGPVYHVVMSWAEGQKPTQEQQQEAARSLLAMIGLDKAQALVVAHNDNGKEHLHIMANLVDPETGKRFSLSNDQHKMQAWALEYERAHGGVILKAREERAEKWAKGERPAKAERLPRPAYNRIDRAARDAAFTRQAEERASLRTAHSAEWKAAKAEAAAMRAAYKSAFRDAYAKAKAADRAENKPKWRDLFRRQQADTRSMDYAADHAEQQAETARKDARRATLATERAARRSDTLLGGLAQRLGLAATPEAAQERQRRAVDQMERAALHLATVQLGRASLKAKQDAERAALAKALGEVTFAKAQLAVDEMPRANFAAIITRQNAEKAAQIAAHNAERDELGMKRYEPKTSRKDDPMSLTERSSTTAFDAARQRQQPERGNAPVQGAQRTLTPDGRSTGTTPGAPQRQPEPVTATANENASKRPASAFELARQKANSPEAKAERERQQSRRPSRDFDNER